MSVLEHEVLLVGSKGRERCRALFDSGSSYSIIRGDIAERLANLELLQEPEDWVFETAREGDLIQALYSVQLILHFDDSKERFLGSFIVFDSLSEEVIIGAQSMQSWQVKLDFGKETIDYPKIARRLRV